ncbi:hypothetical protein M5D96_005588 [Drosophila gunungcola]|uniref:Uncharacterized protein n=1 Tax=Drosophila gunungcola TaxID=103775 RepID=A0A9Q0BRB5_9MUSC|nr:hypothetical protein M5D96_005588 [Drosophila gunungcola]
MLGRLATLALALPLALPSDLVFSAAEANTTKTHAETTH